MPRKAAQRAVAGGTVKPKPAATKAATATALPRRSKAATQRSSKGATPRSSKGTTKRPVASPESVAAPSADLDTAAPEVPVQWLGQIHQGDCIDGLQQLPADSIDLVFADPPFNIGFSYDVYDDRVAADQYLQWSTQWMAAVHRVLRPSGSFWLAIGDEYAAELKIRAGELGFTCRSWVIWYYTFGVHCKYKFTRSHAHLFHFVKDAKQFQFHPEAVRVPSARQLVYADARAATGGRMPDDTWVLRPQDLVDGFTAGEDCWYFPRVAGTFKERAGFHGCQMPEQLLGRIIRSCSELGDVVIDPFSGSSTTVAVAKKLGRRWFSFELSEEYVRLGTARLAAIQRGDALDGSPEPQVSAPATDRGKRRTANGTVNLAAGRQSQTSPAAPAFRLPQADPAFGFASDAQRALFDLTLSPEEQTRLLQTVLQHSDGFTVDRLIADPALNGELQRKWDRAGVLGTPAERNRCLFQLRATGQLAAAGHQPSERTVFSWDDQQPYRFASEIAWSRLAAEYPDRTLDELLCNPDTALQLDAWAERYAPGFRPLEYRWAALALRRQLRSRRDTLLADEGGAAAADALPPLGKPLAKLQPGKRTAGQAGVYAIGMSPEQLLYVGETPDLAATMQQTLGTAAQTVWWTAAAGGQPLRLWWQPLGEATSQTPLKHQLAWVGHYRPRWNASDFCLPAESGKTAGRRPKRR